MSEQSPFLDFHNVPIDLSDGSDESESSESESGNENEGIPIPIHIVPDDVNSFYSNYLRANRFAQYRNQIHENSDGESETESETDSDLESDDENDQVVYARNGLPVRMVSVQVQTSDEVDEELPVALQAGVSPRAFYYNRGMIDLNPDHMQRIVPDHSNIIVPDYSDMIVPDHQQEILYDPSYSVIALAERMQRRERDESRPQSQLEELLRERNEEDRLLQNFGSGDRVSYVRFHVDDNI